MKKSYQILGILNITPDSFSDGGLFFDPQKALIQAQKLLKNGADIIDVGGESTRPGAQELSIEEEWGRISRVLVMLIDKIGIDKISLDTRKAQIAKRFAEIGGKIINDVSGCQDPQMPQVILDYNLTIFLNHFPGQTIAAVHQQAIDDINIVKQDLLKTAQKLESIGIKHEKIILDPGIGFGKTMDLNWQLLKFSREITDYPVLIGHSRKRFLGANRMDLTVNQQAAQIAIKSGAKFLRVHEIGDL
jgi:dihydropteroate synthase